MDIEQTIRDYLPLVLHLSLATVRNDTPWVSEVHFAYDDQLNLYFRSLSSRRHSQEIRENPKVAGNIVKQHELGQPVVGVYFEGTAELLPPGKTRQQAFECIQRRLRASDSILDEATRADGHQFYKITVTNYYLFGAFSGQPSQKYMLPWKGGCYE